MNAERARCAAIWLGLASASGLAVHPAQALDLAEAPTLIGDPLSADPELLRQGQPFRCNVPFDPQAELSLAAAVDRALCQNPQVKLAWTGIKIQAGLVGEGRAAYLPTVNVSTSRLFNTTEYPGSDIPAVSNQGTSKYANVSWRLFNFGAREANLDSANLLLHAAIVSHHATLQKVLNALIDAYFDAVTAAAVHQARVQAETLAEQTLQATRRREAGGAAAMSDVLQAQTALAKARLARARAQGERLKSAALLAYQMGVATEVPLRLPAGVEASPKEDLRDLKAWLDQARLRHPAIAAAQAQLQAARAKIAAVRDEGFGSVDLSYSYYENGYPNQGLSAVATKVTTYGLTLTIPLFEGFARNYKVRGAAAQAEQSEARLHDTVIQVSLEVIKAHADAQTSAENLSASQALLDAAEEASRSSARRYAKGAADILELLSTQNALAEAQQERIRCLSEWSAARLRLLSAVGVLEQIPGGAQAVPLLKP
jgi:outer membrane protein